MIRYICDRCHVEYQDEGITFGYPIRIKIEGLANQPIYKEQRVDLCNKCRGEYRAIEAKLKDICADMWEEFMKGGGKE